MGTAFEEGEGGGTVCEAKAWERGGSEGFFFMSWIIVGSYEPLICY